MQWVLDMITRHLFLHHAGKYFLRIHGREVPLAAQAPLNSRRLEHFHLHCPTLLWPVRPSPSNGASPSSYHAMPSVGKLRASSRLGGCPLPLHQLH